LTCAPMMTGLDEVSADPGFWVNRVVAEYYRLNSIKLKPGLEMKKKSKKIPRHLRPLRSLSPLNNENRH
jgi:hypothetical protein